MITERHEFQGALGGQIAARLERPLGDIQATAVFAHCFSCSKDILAAKRIATKLSALGIAVLRFDFTGLGHSEGEFSNTNFSSNLDDLKAAVAYLGEVLMPPALLVGHSLGGTAVLNVAGQCPSVKAVATIGAPFHAEHVSNIFAQDLKTIEELGEAEVDLGGRNFLIKKQFLDDISHHRTETALNSMRAALLVLHAPLDQQVGIENATEIFTHAKHPKSFISLDDANHLVTRAEDADYAASVIAAWASRYIDLSNVKKYEDYPEGVVRVREADASRFLQDVVVNGKFQLTADEPKSYGGDDFGPSPYQFLSVGLGACTSMTIRMYARRKKYPLDHVFVDVAHEKTHVEAMKDEGLVDKFVRRIALEGELSEEERADLLRVAGLCPVHKTLETHSHIETVLHE